MADPTIHRRELIKLLGASGVAVSTAAFFQSGWIKPVVKVGVLPAHAQASEEPPPITSPVTFNSGENLSWTVPAGVTSLRITALGAEGGGIGIWQGGLGGRVEAELAVTPGEILSYTVGGQGQAVPSAPYGLGGVGGGGNGGDCDITYGGGGGGGASWIWRGSTPLVVAGGGGGYANSSIAYGGAGGGDTGASGGGSAGGSGGLTGGTGGSAGGNGVAGTSTAGGSGGYGSGYYDIGGGGGGGGYGGGGGGGGSTDSTDDHGGGGGGASYVIPGATVTVNSQGVNSGNGQIIFAWG